jgi:hypothetical protein
MLRTVVLWKLTDVSEVLTASIISHPDDGSSKRLRNVGQFLPFIVFMMEAVSTSETLVSFYQTTRRNISVDNHLHTRRCEKLKSHNFSVVLLMNDPILFTLFIILSPGYLTC